MKKPAENPSKQSNTSDLPESLSEQREKDWDKRYLSKDYPWEEENPSLSILPFLKKYLAAGASILEIGCGLGTNALWLSSEGFAVDAIDISPECIRLAEERKQKSGSKAVFMAHDFLTSVPQKKYNVLFERGCFHSFSTQSGLDNFAAATARSYPRVSLRALSKAVEPNFEILELVRKPFGEKNSLFF